MLLKTFISASLTGRILRLQTRPLHAECSAGVWVGPVPMTGLPLRGGKGEEIQQMSLKSLIS